MERQLGDALLQSLALAGRVSGFALRGAQLGD